MDKNDCMYCLRDERLSALMTPIEVLPAAVVYLYTRNSDFPGRCVVALDIHETELFYLDFQKRRDFIESVTRTAQAIYSAATADKINYAVYGDTAQHLHFHLVPKHKNGPDWNRPFTLTREDDPPGMPIPQIEFWKSRLQRLLKGS